MLTAKGRAERQAFVMEWFAREPDVPIEQLQRAVKKKFGGRINGEILYGLRRQAWQSHPPVTPENQRLFEKWLRRSDPAPSLPEPCVLPIGMLSAATLLVDKLRQHNLADLALEATERFVVISKA